MRKGKYINCHQCGESFYVKPYQIRDGAKFCSMKCSQWSQRRRADFPCWNCGLIMNMKLSYGNKHKHFCSPICFKIYWKEKGRTCSDDVKKQKILNLGTRMLGKKHSEITKKKMSMVAMGKKKIRRLNVVSSLGKRLRETIEYKNWRKFVFARDNYTCIFCGQWGGNLHADHITPFGVFVKLLVYENPNKTDNELLKIAEDTKYFWNVDNGRTLCLKCHKNTDSYLNIRKINEIFTRVISSQREHIDSPEAKSFSSMIVKSTKI